MLGELAGEDGGSHGQADGRNLDNEEKGGDARRGLTTGEKASTAEEVCRRRGVGRRRVEESGGGVSSKS